MNIVGWLLHFAVLAQCWPLIRHWWHGDASLGYEGRVPRGRKRWAVLASFLLPIVSWFWLVPCATGQRWREQERRDIAQRVRERAQRERDVAFWREQVATGDLLAAWSGLELLAMWKVPLVEPETEALPPVSDARPVPQALPGAHGYSRECACRNCERARNAVVGWLASPPRLTQQEADDFSAAFLAHREALTRALASSLALEHAPSCECTQCRPELYEREIFL